ncbi:GspH/FimT family pseudopilin [Dyella psychrodurans]|uniref:Type II secretion system protein H n=1 Tax=Dyella psychrodurans TaxID=1927960 RepID=A0A370XAZ2_9GAMM|nr:GspH/FimT family pseudopilin [Dyella psychrodurans]RDS85440.1 prepilin-type N-terminal cleavage/methylation domain-containing protein [Dyella psychrodurans]
MRPERVKAPFRDTQRGFGLIEQIMTLVVLAVLSTVAIPSFHHLFERHELRAAQTDYIAALQHARNLAINEQRQIIFCPSRDGLRCNGDGSWSGGWLIGRHDLDNKGQPLGSPLYTGGHYSEKIAIAGSEAKKYIAFKTDGSLAGSNQTLTFCIRDEPQQALKVLIALRGRVRGEVATAADASPCVTPA